MVLGLAGSDPDQIRSGGRLSLVTAARKVLATRTEPAALRFSTLLASY